MSEFNDGLLVLKSDTALVQAALTNLEHRYIFKNLNEKWSVIMLEQPDDAARPWVEHYSHDFPLLYFYDAEDHGWGYIIFHEGDEKASLEVGYELSYKYWRQIADILYPEGANDGHGDLDIRVSHRIHRLIERSDAYRQEIKDQYTSPKLEAFDVFGVSLDEIDELREIVRPRWYRKRINGLQQVDAFKRVLGIQDMNWMSYHHLSRDGDEGRL
jgi:hypothetical protein